MSFVPPAIQLVPPGLLEFLGVKNGGANPRALFDGIQPTFEMLEWYAATQALTVSASGAALITADGSYLTGTGTIQNLTPGWILQLDHSVVAQPGGTTTFAAYAQWLTTYNGNGALVSSGIGAGASAGVASVVNFPRLQLVPPGSTLQLNVSGFTGVNGSWTSQLRYLPLYPRVV